MSVTAQPTSPTMDEVVPSPISSSSASASAPAPVPLLLRLPPELIDYLLHHVRAQDQQLTALSLSRVFPDHWISQRFLWTHLIVYRAQQIWPLWRKLKSDQVMRDGVRTFALQSWRGDVDILNNVMRCLTSLRTLMLNIGTNFAPEHLEEMFEKPRKEIERMELRFRPYVEQASYYQFLKGSYFDTAIETLTKHWPSLPSFTHLSIVQDLPPRSTAPPTAFNSTAASLANSFTDLSLAAEQGSDSSSGSDGLSGRSTPPTSISSVSDNPTDASSKSYTGHGPFGNPYLNEKLGIVKPKTFAQPIVFFDIQCLAKFGAASVAENLTHLRLRVPSRDLARVLITTPRDSISLFPSLRYLDISTTNVRLDTTLSTLLRTYSRLEHLVLDRVNLFGFTAREKGSELCHDLGGLLVSAGLARGKERERQISTWEVQERTRLAEAEAAAARARSRAREDVEDPLNDEQARQDAEAIAAMERMAEQQRAVELARSRRGHRSAAHSTFSLRDRPTRRSTTTVGSSASTVPLPPPDKLYLVLPPLPTLKSISIGGEAHAISSAKVAEWEEQFHEGWKDGLGRLLGWATHVADKFERAKRKAEEWREQEIKSSTASASSSTNSKSGSGAGSKGKRRPSHGSSTGTSGAHKVKPPTDVRLFRFPLPAEVDVESIDQPSEYNITAGLIEIFPESNHRYYLEPYKLALGDSELYSSDRSYPPPCVLCTVPDCEGPARRGAEGERVDGRGGMAGVHMKGCGHLIGRKIWGWDGF